MPERLTCRSGHRWEAPTGEVSRASLLCPICGSSVQAEYDPHLTVDLQPGSPFADVPAESENDYQTQIPGYKVLKELARGGGGTVIQALHEGCNRLVSLKVLYIGSVTGAVRVERFRREARLLARLDHPHIVPVYDAGESWNRLYYAMKFLAGGSLRQRISAVSAAPDVSIDLLIKIAEALHYLHGQGIVHCDLKPANILFDDRGEPYLCDFGIARTPEDDSIKANPSRILGTPAYMAPELTEDAGAIGPTTDIWSVGVILYEILTGRLPFQASSSTEILRLAREVQPERPRLLNPNCLAPLEEICLRCLQKDSRDRPASTRELASLLRGVLDRTAGGSSSGKMGDSWFDRLPADVPHSGSVSERHDGADHMLRAGLDSMAEGVLVLDATGKVVRCNLAAERILGRNLTGLSLPDWMERQTWLRSDAAAALPLHRLPPIAALRGEPTEEIEVFLAPGERRHGGWIVLAAWPLARETGDNGAVVVLRDVTALKTTLGSGKLYHSLLSLLGLNVFRKDEQGRYTFVNRLFCDSVGKQPEQILGCTDFDLFSADLARQVAAKEDLVRDSGGVTEYVEEHTPAPVSPTVAAWCSGSRRRRPSRTATLGIFKCSWRRCTTTTNAWSAFRERSGTSRRAGAERQLEQANAELARSNQDLEQFAYVASHDLQEPLRMVASFTKLLQKRYQHQLDQRADRYIHFAVDGAVRMQRLINDLLDYSRVGSRGKPLQDESCEEAFDRALQNLRETVRESSAVVTRGPLPHVRGDSTQLMQLFQNLIGNAIKFRGSAQPAVQVSARRDSGRGEWVFKVQDNGIGIEPQYLERIFVIFQRLHTKDQYPGSGIGLAICKRIVERHGGRIWAESRLGEGSSFCFTLPGV